MDIIHIVVSFIVCFLCEIPTGEAGCAERTSCCHNDNCTAGSICFNSVCYNKTGTCDTDWTHHDGFCYFFSTENKTWAEANATCAQYATPGLVEVDSETVDNVIKNHLSENTDTEFGHLDTRIRFWIGGTSSVSLDSIALSNNRSITDFYWKECFAYEYEGVLEDTGLSTVFPDLHCYEKYRYICKKNSGNRRYMRVLAFLLPSVWLRWKGLRK